MLQFKFILALKFILLLTCLTFGYMRYQNVHLSLHTILNFIIQATDSLLNFSTIGALTFLSDPLCSLGAEFSLGPNPIRVLSNNSASASPTATNISGIEFTGYFVRGFYCKRLTACRNNNGNIMIACYL